MNRVLLNNVDHADLRVAIRAGVDHGDAVNQVPIYPAEFEEAQRCFPIIFRAEEKGLQAYALLGLDRDENLFLDRERWTSSYVPAFQRRGPFSVGISRAGPDDVEAGQPMIHVDLDDPRVGASEGLPVFLPHGGNAPLLTHMTEVLRVVFEGMQGAAAIYAAWQEAGLFRPITMQVSFSDEQHYELPDLLAIDRQALAGLPGDSLERLHRDGLLEGAILAASSLGNVQRLIDIKRAKVAA